MRLLEDSDACVGAILPNGRCEVGDSISELPIHVRARCKRFFERLRDGHPVKSPENMRHLGTDRDGNALHELENHSPAIRIYLVRLARPAGTTRWVATHGTKKVEDGRVPAEMARAWAIYYGWADRG